MKYKILHIGGFDKDKIRTDWPLACGFKKLGHDVDMISYDQFSNTSNVILSIIDKYDFVFIGNVVNKLGTDLTKLIKQKKNIKVCFWYGDQRKDLNIDVLKYLKYVDFFFHTTGGKRLIQYKNSKKNIVAAFMPNPIVEVTNIEPKKYADVVFTGRPNKKTHIGSDNVREDVIDFLINRNNNFDFKTFGYNSAPVLGKDYYALIKGCKIGIGINTFNNFYKYTSARLSHFMTNGAFYLCKQFPGIETLFTDGKHLVLWNEKEELVEKIEYYLKHDEERKKIAEEGKQYFLENYSPERIAQYIIDVIENNDNNEIWKEVYR